MLAKSLTKCAIYINIILLLCGILLNYWRVNLVCIFSYEFVDTGCQERGSCLLHYLTISIKHLTAFSDTVEGGWGVQTKIKHILKFWHCISY